MVRAALFVLASATSAADVSYDSNSVEATKLPQGNDFQGSLELVSGTRTYDTLRFASTGAFPLTTSFRDSYNHEWKVSVLDSTDEVNLFFPCTNRVNWHGDEDDSTGFDAQCRMCEVKFWYDAGSALQSHGINLEAQCYALGSIGYRISGGYDEILDKVMKGISAASAIADLIDKLPTLPPMEIMSTAVDVCATVEVVDEAFIDEFKAGLYASALVTRTEPGVLRFDIFENADNKAEFTLREQYASQADYDVHKETDAFKQFIAMKISGAIDVTVGCPQQSKVTSDDATTADMVLYDGTAVAATKLPQGNDFQGSLELVSGTRTYDTLRYASTGAFPLTTSFRDSYNHEWKVSIVDSTDEVNLFFPCTNRVNWHGDEDDSTGFDAQCRMCEVKFWYDAGSALQSHGINLEAQCYALGSIGYRISGGYDDIIDKVTKGISAATAIADLISKIPVPPAMVV